MTQPAEHSSTPSDPPASGGPGRSTRAREDLLKRRLHSLDAYRGLIMISLAFGGFGLARTAGIRLEEGADPSFWATVQYQFSHVDWTGCGYWDLIQPSFMFMVGVSMAYSYTKRKELGQSYARMLGHAAWRSVVLVFLGIFLTSSGRESTNWSLMNVLTQIGLGYMFLFLLWGRSPRTQALAAAVILTGTWLAYTQYPAAGIDLTTGAEEVGVSGQWVAEHLANISHAWHKNANVGQWIDVRLLNMLPRQEAFVSNSGGYQTINFIPSLATMLFGLMCGELLRSPRSQGQKLAILMLAGIIGLVAGQVLHQTGICPVVKRIWTPSWALFSTGWCCLILAALYGIVDVLNFRLWAFPLVVVGVNSIAMYSMGMLLKPWTAGTLKTHLGSEVFRTWGAAYEPTVQAVMVGMMFWLVCVWMYRQKVFLRI